jgi:hypothetical protein
METRPPQIKINTNHNKPMKTPANRRVSSRPKLIAVCALTLSTMGSLSAANILLNSGFESGTAADADNWGEFGASSNAISGRSDVSPFTGTHHAYMAIDNTTTVSGAALFVEQNLGANTIDSSKTYDLTFYAKSDTTDFTGINMFAQIQWLDQDGSDGGGFKGETLQSLIGFGPGLNTSYQQFSMSGLTPAAGSDSFLVRFQLAAGAISGIQNGLSVDDISLSQVPEPSSSILLGLGALALLRRRRH